MKKITIGIFALLIVAVSISSCMSVNPLGNKPYSIASGLYNEGEESRVMMSFENNVFTWLRRYSPRRITRTDGYARMQARYDSLFDIELFLKDGVYEVVVTYAELGFPIRNAQRNAIHLSTGIYRRMENTLRQLRR